MKGTGFVTKDTAGMEYSSMRAIRADFCLAMVTTSIVGSLPRQTTDTIATHNSISAARRPASSPISTKSLAQR